MNTEFIRASGIAGLAAIAVFVGGMFTGAQTCNPRRTTVCTDTTRVDIRIDTVEIPVPQPARVELVENRVEILKRDTTYVHVAGDSVAVEVPITRKEYQTPEFKATVQGYKPELLDVTVYPKTVTLTTVKKPRFSVVAGAGVGWNGKEIAPQIGISAGFVLWSK